MDNATFYRGLLYGLWCAGSSEFVAEGARFHRAFREILDRARELGVDAELDSILSDFDPVPTC